MTIAQKSTAFGTKGKFVSIVGPKIGPTCTSKNSKHGIIRFVMEQDLKRGGIMKKFGRGAIN
jgi:hypothetical protein